MAGGRSWEGGRSAAGFDPARMGAWLPRPGLGVKLLLAFFAGTYLAEALWVHWVAPAVGFAAGAVGEGGADAALRALHLMLEPGRFVAGEVWTAFTYVLLHDPSSPFHLLFNLLFLWIFGAELERFWGLLPFLRRFLLFALGGALGVMAVAALLPGEWDRPVLGASGAVYGLVAAYGVVYGERVLWPLPIKARHLVWVLLGFSLLGFLLRSTESLGAHLGGLISGVILARGLWRPRRLWSWLRGLGRRRAPGARPRRPPLVVILPGLSDEPDPSGRGAEPGRPGRPRPPDRWLN